MGGCGAQPIGQGHMVAQPPVQGQYHTVYQHPADGAGQGGVGPAAAAFAANNPIPGAWNNYQHMGMGYQHHEHGAAIGGAAGSGLYPPAGVIPGGAVTGGFYPMGGGGAANLQKGDGES